jgi:7-cyano-7-deazaguanine synthase
LAAERVCVLTSGGVDSAVLVWHVLQSGVEVQPVYVATGMQWEAVETIWLDRYLMAIAAPGLLPLKRLELPLEDVYDRHWSVGGEVSPGYDAPDEAVYLPGRNIVLAAKTAIYCALNGIERIASGVLMGNPFPDATTEFFSSLERTLSLGLDHTIRTERPFSTMHKVDVVRLGHELPLELSFSCINPVGELHCGDCNKCAERQLGFNEAGVPDRTVYARPPSQA